MYSPVIWDDGSMHNIVYETFYWTVGAGVAYETIMNLYKVLDCFCTDLILQISMSFLFIQSIQKTGINRSNKT